MNVFDMESYLGNSRFNGMLYDIAWRKSKSALADFVDNNKNGGLLKPEFLLDERSWLNLTVERDANHKFVFSVTIVKNGYMLFFGDVGKNFRYFDFYLSTRIDDIQHYVVQYLRNRLIPEDFEKHVKLS